MLGQGAKRGFDEVVGRSRTVVRCGLYGPREAGGDRIGPSQQAEYRPAVAGALPRTRQRTLLLGGQLNFDGWGKATFFHLWVVAYPAGGPH